MAPLFSKPSWSEVKNFSEAVVCILVQEHLDKYTDQLSKLKRWKKIFIDYLRDDRGATAIASYSTRAKVNAVVALPMAWTELSNSSFFKGGDLNKALKRLRKIKKDPW